jgi:hypothetical protein
MPFSLRRPARPRTGLGFALVLTITSLAMLPANAAHAAPSLGLDLEGAIPLDSHTKDADSLQGGSGFKVRFGDQIHLPLLRITPEVGFALDRLFGDGGSAYSGYAWDMERIFVGGRIGFGAVVVPTLYAHVGYGWRTTDDPAVPEGNGVAFDGGLALDLHLIRHFGFGAHAEYDTVATGGGTTPRWLALGLHLDIEL